MANNTIGTHNDWKAVKKQFGIPDKVSKFGLGDRIGAFDKAMAALGTADYDDEKKLLDGMEVTLKTYAADLAKVAAAKFKGKTAQEQAKSFDGAKKAVANLRTQLDGRMKLVKMCVEPFGELLAKFPQVEQQLNGLDVADKKAAYIFYRQEMRNTLGLPVRRALKLGDKIGGKVLAALQEYEDLLEPLDGLVNASDDPPQGITGPQWVIRESRKALNVIKPFLK